MLEVRETKIRKRSHDFAQHKNDSIKFPNLLASKIVDRFILYLQTISRPGQQTMARGIMHKFCGCLMIARFAQRASENNKERFKVVAISIRGEAAYYQPTSSSEVQKLVIFMSDGWDEFWITNERARRKAFHAESYYELWLRSVAGGKVLVRILIIFVMPGGFYKSRHISKIVCGTSTT